MPRIQFRRARVRIPIPAVEIFPFRYFVPIPAFDCDRRRYHDSIFRRIYFRGDAVFIAKPIAVEALVHLPKFWESNFPVPEHGHIQASWNTCRRDHQNLIACSQRSHVDQLNRRIVIGRICVMRCLLPHSLDLRGGNSGYSRPAFEIVAMHRTEVLLRRRKSDQEEQSAG